MVKRLFALVVGFVMAVATLALVAPVQAQAAPVSCGISTGTYTNFGTPQGPRKLKIFVPAGANSNTPMLFSLHGATGTAEGQEAVSNFTGIGQRDGAIIVYPQALGVPGSTIWDATPNSNDVKFVAQATQFMHTYGCSNPTKTYLNGFSMGAMMTSRLMCSNSNLYAGASMVDGVLPPTPGCRVPPSKTIVIIHGTSDTVVPYDGSLPATWLQVMAGGTAITNYPGIDRAHMGRLWEQAKGCANPPDVQQPGGVWKFDWTGCRTAGTYAFAYLYTNHVWNPNPAVSSTTWTSEVIWSLMKPENPAAYPVPSTGVVKVSTGQPNAVVFGNLTVTNAGTPGYTTAYTCGAQRPNVSVNNYVAGQTTPNFTAVKTDANGDFCVYASGLADVLWDQTTSDTTGKVNVVAPSRKADTRVGNYDTYAIPALGEKVNPATAAPAAANTPVSRILRVHTGIAGSHTMLGNLTVTEPQHGGYTTVWPCDQPRPLASTNNYVPGQTTPNFTAVKTDTNGDFCVFTKAPAALIFDLVATSDAVTAAGPTRLADTRATSWETSQTPPIGSIASATVNLSVAGTPVSGERTLRISTPQANTTYLANITVTEPESGGYTTVWPCDQPRPLASTNNYVPGQTTPNFVLATSDSQADVCVASRGTTQVVFDSYGTVAMPAFTPVRKLDTRDTWTPGS